VLIGSQATETPVGKSGKLWRIEKMA